VTSEGSPDPLGARFGLERRGEAVDPEGDVMGAVGGAPDRHRAARPKA
jgi:hypothetical protein